MSILPRPVRSSLGLKYWMALTGLALIGFVLVHMAGNLLVFVGRDALNSYAKGLKHRPALLWTARSGLLVVFLLHVVLGLQLSLKNSRARPVHYAYPDQTVRASWASRHMLLTGLLLLAFILYHLAHFTFGVVTHAERRDPLTGQTFEQNYLDLKETHDPARPTETRPDVYSMVVLGFRNPWVTGSYLIAMIFLWLHLWHGASSWMQSLGINHPKYNPILFRVGPVLATLVLIGNCSMPLGVYLDHAFNLGFFQM